MKTILTTNTRIARLLTAMFLFSPVFSAAQVPVDDDGNVLGTYETDAEIMQLGEEGIPRLSSMELEELVGPVALYPDDLLAIVLPASAYPLQIAAAARFLEAYEIDSSLKPDPEWDDSVVALINYPEVVELLNNDLDWTYRLGEAVVAQQTDVVAAVESFRDRAYAAGNLKSDSYQTVSREDGNIEIAPVAEDVIYVPYYEPTRVVVYQPRPAYYYYPRPRPVYYYPYSAGHHFDHGYFWGVTTAFSIGWLSDSLHVYHHSYSGHPYYGRRYWDNWWYRRPSINVYNTTYRHNSNVYVNRYSNGDRWQPRHNRREFTVREGYARSRSDDVRVRRNSERGPAVVRNRTQPRTRPPISFRERSDQLAARTPVTRTQVARTQNTRRENSTTQDRGDTRNARTTRQRETNREDLVFRSRDTSRRQPVVRARDTSRQETTVRSRDTSRQQTVDRSRTSQRQQPAVRSRDTNRQRPVVRQQRPSANTERRSVERSGSSRQERAPRQQAARQNSGSSGSSERPQRKSKERSERSRDRQR